LLEPAKIEVDLSNANLSDILDNSLKFYYWNEDISLWEPIPSFYDALTLTIYGYTNHFSQFAVFGINKNAWEHTVLINNSYISVNKQP